MSLKNAPSNFSLSNTEGGSNNATTSHLLPPELEQTFALLTSHRSVLGYLLLSRGPQVAIIRHSGVVFEGDQGKKYAHAVERIVESVHTGLEEVAGESGDVVRSMSLFSRVLIDSVSTAGWNPLYEDPNQTARTSHFSRYVPSSCVCNKGRMNTQSSDGNYLLAVLHDPSTTWNEFSIYYHYLPGLVALYKHKGYHIQLRILPIHRSQIVCHLFMIGFISSWP